MCSWCWGIAPELKKLQSYADESAIGFRIVVGGLRPGGGDPWDEQMKEFLKHHWHEVHARSGQLFGYDLFNLSEFNYDTEPACRAVVAARPLVKDNELLFFEKIQEKFYVHSKDPSQTEFYQSICEDMSIDFEQFIKHFLNEGVVRLTHEEFILNRKWGVRGYPTILLRSNDKIQMITHGYTNFEMMKERVDQLIRVRL